MLTIDLALDDDRPGLVELGVEVGHLLEQLAAANDDRDVRHLVEVVLDQFGGWRCPQVGVEDDRLRLASLGQERW